ncbi:MULTISPECIES: alpha-ketoglutarate-dependent dioxygenase AlkB [unclassified Frankia]|uniref:alpha-ketoglutarate-dependent dioxygenase AlkB n=1 Tax=unclassified Frankia TaxID=2632575 RepID=UPI002AD590D5|nr:MULTISPECIES: alpha-ketoglutarate-dependent dioxygenase AlkB [unclassified Frankia]
MDDGLFGRSTAVVAPGAVLLPDWLDSVEQRRMLGAARRWAAPPAGLRHPRMPDGTPLRVASVCLGWHWSPYRYSRYADDSDGDGAPVKPLPAWLVEMARAAVVDASGIDPTVSAEPASYCPDAAIVNYYDDNARLGLHQDRAEHTMAPVVSFSIGNVCVFRFGNPHTRTRPWRDVELRSGDLFVFGGPSRLAYHGVPRTMPGSAPPELGMRHGRLSVTVRETGLAGQPGRPVTTAEGAGIPPGRGSTGWG